MNKRSKYKKYNLLIEEVSCFDKEAGRILKSFKYLPNSNKFKKSIWWDSPLNTLFMWGKSPQGGSYWGRIYKSLEAFRQSKKSQS